MNEAGNHDRLLRVARVAGGMVGAGMVLVASVSAVRSGIGRLEQMLFVLGIGMLAVAWLGHHAPRLYRGAAVTLLNTMVLLVFLELGAAFALTAIDRYGQSAARLRAVKRLPPQPNTTDVPADERSPYFNDKPWAKRLWVEEREADAISRYHPYELWRSAPYQGEQINILADGHRRTPGVQCVPGAFTVYILGGSTMWGYGVPDWGTIAAYVQGAASARIGGPVCVVNFGALGFTSTQSLIALQRRLQCGHVPDLAIFYDGVNDLNYAHRYREAGIHDNADQFAERLDTGWRPRGRGMEMFYLYRLLRLLNPRPEAPARFPAGQTDIPASLDDNIVAVYLNNYRMVGALAATYGFDYAFFWQPHLLTERKPLAPAEVRIKSSIRDYGRWLDGVSDSIPPLERLYLDVYRQVRGGGEPRPAVRHRRCVRRSASGALHGLAPPGPRSEPTGRRADGGASGCASPGCLVAGPSNVHCA
ncbi:MAG: SGNH/GDSL hydrolase family protein [Gemmatimonadaceae bacterium]